MNGNLSFIMEFINAIFKIIDFYMQIWKFEKLLIPYHIYEVEIIFRKIISIIYLMWKQINCIISILLLKFKVVKNET